MAKSIDAPTALAAVEEGPTHSAALLVAGENAWPLVDLRVDGPDDPVGDLRDLWVRYEPQMNDYLRARTQPGDSAGLRVPAIRERF